MLPSLMETLDAAAFGSERHKIKPSEIWLIFYAERWLRDHGWENHHVRGWTNDERAFGQDNGFNGLVLRERRHGIWESDGVRHPVRSVVAGLNILVNEEILPAHFSTFGIQALLDFAKALDLAAEELEARAESLPGGYSQTQERDRLQENARALRDAAEQARQHDPIGVLA